MPHRITGPKHNKLSTQYPAAVLQALDDLARQKTEQTGTLVAAGDLVREAVQQYLKTQGINLEVEVNRGGYRGEPTPRKEFPPEKVDFTTDEAAAYVGLHPYSFRRYVYDDAQPLKFRRKNPKAEHSAMIFDRAELDRFRGVLDESR